MEAMARMFREEDLFPAVGTPAQREGDVPPEPIVVSRGNLLSGPIESSPLTRQGPSRRVDQYGDPDEYPL